MTTMDAHRHFGNKYDRSYSICDHKTDDLRPQNTTLNNTVIPVYMHISYVRLPKCGSTKQKHQSKCFKWP